jgi:hypothetical protein
MQTYIRDLCNKPPFANSQRQAQILILEIFNIFLRLKLSPSLTLTKIGHFSKVSIHRKQRPQFFLDRLSEMVMMIIKETLWKIMEKPW